MQRRPLKVRGWEDRCAQPIKSRSRPGPSTRRAVDERVGSASRAASSVRCSRPSTRPATRSTAGSRAPGARARRHPPPARAAQVDARMTSATVGACCARPREHEREALRRPERGSRCGRAGLRAGVLSSRRLREYARVHADLIELTSRMVAIDSVNPSLVPGGAGEVEMARFVVEWARNAGLEAEVLEATPGRPSVVVTARGSRRWADAAAVRAHRHGRGRGHGRPAHPAAGGRPAARPRRL